MVPQSFCIVFQNNPVWLLALQSQFVSKIFVLGSITFDDFNARLENNILSKGLYHKVIELLGPNLFTFSSPPQDTIYLISGDVTFLNEKFEQFRTKKGIYVTEVHTRIRRRLPSTSIPVNRVNHVMMGGITTFQSLYAYTPSPLQPKFSSLVRTVGDFMDYSIAPTSVTPDSINLHYKGNLPIKHIDKSVYYPTPFSYKGFGYRPLTNNELRKIFGFEWEIPLTINMQWVFPIQILDGLLHPMLQSATLQYEQEHTPPPSYVDSGSTYFPCINKSLPHLWHQQVDISLSAVKSDGALHTSLY